MTDTAPDAETAARAQIYLVLGRLLALPADRATLDAVSRMDDDAGALDGTLAALAAAARSADVEAVARDYERIFIGVGRGELVPYASWYLTGFVGERPLVGLRDDMAAIGIERAADVREPEDHIAALCEMMSGIVSGALGPGNDPELQSRFFRRHIDPWAGRFFQDLYELPGSGLYGALGGLGRAFVEYERGVNGHAARATGGA